jgi:hypothetical protein
MHTALRLGLRVAARVRALNPSAHVCFYGHYAFLNRDLLLGRFADSVVGGECEKPLLRLVESLEREASRDRPANRDGNQLAGVSLPGRPAPPFLERIDFSAPAREDLPPLDRYAQLEVEGDRRLAGSVEASRGCRHLCRHCPVVPVYGGRFFVVAVEDVLADVRWLVALGADHVTFADPDFLNGSGHAMAVARAVHAEFPRLTFDVTVKVEHILRRRALLPELRGLGCLFVVSAFESLSETVLTILDKGHTAEDCGLALEIASSAGITLRPTWVAFTPWTRHEDYREMLDFIDRHDLIDRVDPVQYAIRLLVPFGSALLGHPAMQSRLGPFDEGALAYRWTADDPRMDALYRNVAAFVAEHAAARGRGADARGGTAQTMDDREIFSRVRSPADSALTGAPGLSATTARIEPGHPSFRQPVVLPRPVSEHAVSGKPWTVPPPPRRRAPRLTEPWYC